MTYFMGQATNEKKMMSCIGSKDLPVERLIPIGSLMPLRMVPNECIGREKKSSKELSNIGMCNIHVVHNTFMKGF